jgi:hypothetical protein
MFIHSTIPPRTDFRQFGILFDFYAPTLVLGQMPMERVELVQRHRINHPLDVVLGNKMSPYVQHHAAPFEPRLIFNLNHRQHPRHPFNLRFGERLRREQLQQGLHTLK